MGSSAVAVTTFKDILLKNSIKHELTLPYLPHKNGLAEHNWSTLFDMVNLQIYQNIFGYML